MKMKEMEILRRLDYDSPVPNIEGTNIFGDITEIEDSVIRKYKSFQSFKLIEDPPTSHKFANQRLVQGKPLYEKAILREWNILKTSLPDSILVRGYRYRYRYDRYRYDLMTAVIKGQGTLYCSNLFFFDIHFPPEYPSCPPQLFFYSNGLDLSSHLTKDGKVLIPLLETKQQKGRFDNNGEWDPENSSLLQVLTSIQSLLALDAQPTPPMDVFGSNKKAFLLDAQPPPPMDAFESNKKAYVAILQTLRSPPENFEDFVAGYYRTHTNAVLNIYRANYKQQMEDQNECVIDLYWMLIQAFEKNGVPCDYHKQHLHELKKKIRHEGIGIGIANQNHGLLGKFTNKLKNLDDVLKFYLDVHF